MKRLPEKMVMAAIILSCGFVTHTEPSAQDRKSKAVPSWEQQKRKAPTAATETHLTKIAKIFTTQEHAP